MSETESTTRILSQGDKVWFDRGHGPEFGHVWAVGDREVAVTIGGGIERTMFPKSEVVQERESLSQVRSPGGEQVHG